MTRRELVIAALEHRETRPIPYDIGFTAQALEQLIAYTGDPDIAGKTGGCLCTAYYDGWPAPIPGRPGFFRDDFGVVWNRTGADRDIGVIERPVIEDIAQSDYALPTVDAARLRAALDQLMAERGDRFTLAGFGFSMFERSWTLMGMENVLVAMLEAPEALEAFYDRLCDFWLGVMDIALAYDIDAIHFGDDWGQQRGLIMGPAHWRRFIKPRMARLYARAKAAGRYVTQHSCGDCHEIFPDLIEIGLDAYQTFQPEIYDIAAIKRQYGDRLTFWGGVSTQQCLPFASPAGVQAEAVRLMRVLGAGGGLIIAPTHAIPGDVPPENITALLEVFAHQDRFMQ